MSVTKVKEVFEGRSAAVDENGIVTITRVMTVTTSSMADGPVIVVAGLRYPETGVDLGSVPIKMFDPHPDYKHAIIRSVDCSPTESVTEWHVALRYSSAPFPARQQGDGSSALAAATGSPSTPSNDPSSGNTNSKPATDRIPTWSFQVKITQEPGENYIDSDDDTIKPYVNTNGDPVEGLMVDRYTDMQTVTYYSFNMTDAARSTRIGRVNDASFRGFATGGCIVRDIRREDVWDYIGDDGDGDPVFGRVWKVQIDLECVNKTHYWQTRILNTGRRGRLAAGGPIITFFDRNGDRVPDPLPLDANGVVLRDPQDASPSPIAASEFYYNTYYDRKSFDFDDLLI